MKHYNGGKGKVSNLSLAFTLASSPVRDSNLTRDPLDMAIIPGLTAWSLEYRRKSLRGVLRAWLLNSPKPVR